MIGLTWAIFFFGMFFLMGPDSFVTQRSGLGTRRKLRINMPRLVAVFLFSYLASWLDRLGSDLFRIIEKAVGLEGLSA